MSLADYTTILLTGRTGKGKSTTGNKLLGAGMPGVRQSDIFVEECVEFPGLPIAVQRTGEKALFDPSSGLESSTRLIKIMTNRNRKICVIDTPGFGDSVKARENLNVKQNNLATFKLLTLIQIVKKITIHRIIYFLPFRGPAEKVEGNMSEELQVLYDFCGSKVFDCMIVVATHNPHFRDMCSFDEECIKITKQVIYQSMTTHLKINISWEGIPALIYLPFNLSHDDTVKLMLEDTEVRNKNGINSIVSEDVCEDCGATLIYNSLPDGIERDQRVHCISVLDITDTYCEYDKSLCHRYIVPKYTIVQRVYGGFLHIASLGIPHHIQKSRGKESWQGFFSDELWCDNCKEIPGRSKGCIKMSQEQMHKKNSPGGIKMI